MPFTILSYYVVAQTGYIDVVTERKLVAGIPIYAQGQRVEVELNFIDGAVAGCRATLWSNCQ